MGTSLHRSHARRALIGVVMVFSLLVVACGDDSGGGSTEAFCKLAEEQDAGDSLDLDNPDDLDAINELVAQSPSEVRGSMEDLRDLAVEFSGLDENDPEAFSAAFALFGDPKFLGAVKEISIFFADECGLEVDGIDEIRNLDPDDPDALLGDLGGDSSE